MYFLSATSLVPEGVTYHTLHLPIIASREVLPIPLYVLCYEINVNEQIEFHTLINSVSEENRSVWWLMNDLQG